LAAYPASQILMSTIQGDGLGGVFAFWQDSRAGAAGTYMQHVLGDGSLASGWPQGGRRIAQGPILREAIPDASGGFYLELSISSRRYTADSIYYVLRVDNQGQTMPGWSPNGTLVCVADFFRQNSRIAADAAGRVFMTWEDYR